MLIDIVPSHGSNTLKPPPKSYSNSLQRLQEEGNDQAVYILTPIQVSISMGAEAAANGVTESEILSTSRQTVLCKRECRFAHLHAPQNKTLTRQAS